MKKTLKVQILLLIISVVVIVFVYVNSTKLWGTYTSVSPTYIEPVSMTFFVDGRVKSRIMGMPVMGHYERNLNRIVITVNYRSIVYSEEGTYENGEMHISGMILKKR